MSYMQILSKSLSYIKVCLVDKYAVINGRASRYEFFSMLCFYLICVLIPNLIPVVGQTISSIIFIALIIPFFTCAARRLNDIKHSRKIITISVILFFISFLSYPIIYLAQAYLMQTQSIYLKDQILIFIFNYASPILTSISLIVLIYLFSLWLKKSVP